MSFSRAYVAHTVNGFPTMLEFDSLEERDAWDSRMEDIESSYREIQTVSPDRDTAKVFCWLNLVYALAQHSGKERVPPYFQQVVNELEDRYYMDKTDWTRNDQSHDLPRFPELEEVMRNLVGRGGTIIVLHYSNGYVHVGPEDVNVSFYVPQSLWHNIESNMNMDSAGADQTQNPVTLN